MPTTTDEATILDLHRQFVAANERIDSDWLRANVSGERLTWFNLNKSNYVGGEHICRLWDFLRTVAGGADQRVTDSEVSVEVVGDVAWVEYSIDLAADFGPMGKVDQHARATEIWERSGDAWLLRHFHCSEHEGGGWEGGV